MNKKVRNAKPIEYNNIQFKSTLEKNCYILFEEAGIKVSYEFITFILMEECDIKDNKYMSYYGPVGKKKNRIFREDNRKLRNVTYTPDFVYVKGNYEFIIEAKGCPNDVYPLKKKMFINCLSKQTPYKTVFFEVHNLKDVKKTIEIIKTMSIREDIRDLCKYLPKKDNKLAITFLEKSDFNNLKELVDSLMYKITCENSKISTDILNNVDKIEKLQMILNVHSSELNIDDSEFENYD